MSRTPHTLIEQGDKYPIESAPLFIIPKLPLPQMRHQAYLLLGGNIDDRESYLNKGIKALEKGGDFIVQQSSIYETAAWGNEDQQPFLNIAIEIATEKQPVVLLERILSIELELGRERKGKWGARTLDIDILFWEDAIIVAPDLIVPHPHIQDRRFALAPLAEIAPDFTHPVFNKTIRQLLDECNDALPVSRLNN